MNIVFVFCKGLGVGEEGVMVFAMLCFAVLYNILKTGLF
jgi:hypothetical protein